MGNWWQRFLVVMVVLAAAAPSPAAEDVKVGVVDLQRCLNESKMGKKYKGEFTAEADQLKAELDQEETSLKKLREELETQGMVLSETARQEKQRDYESRLAAFRDKLKASNQALQRVDMELTNRVFRDVMEVVQGLGEERGYAMIVEKTEAGVMYVPATFDVTDEVIRRYDLRATGD